MGLTEALFSFEGRINRRPLWGFSLFATLIGLITIVFFYYNLPPTWPDHATPEAIEKAARSIGWFQLANLALLWPSIALGIKRAHDRDHSGWYLLLMLIPFVNLWVIIELGCLAGTPGANRFGPDPLPSAKPGLGWLILVGLLIAYSAQIYIAKKTIFIELETHGVPVDLPPAGYNVPAPYNRPAEAS